MNVLLLLTDLFDAVGGIQTFNKSFVLAINSMAEKNWKVQTLVLNDKITRINNAFVFKRNIISFVTSSFVKSLKSEVLIVGHVNFVPLVPLVKLFNPQINIFLLVYGIDVFRKLSFLQYLGIKQVDKIISVSKSTQDQMLLFNKLNKSKFEILSCILNPSFDKNIVLKSRKDLNLPLGPMLLTVSRLDVPKREKNIDKLIRTLPCVIKEIPDVYYVIIGDGPDKDRLEKIACSNEVKDKVLFKGYISDELIPSYYNACDIFVLPSTKEGFGIVFLEAMFFAKPCVGARAGGVPEVIEDGMTGLLCKPNDLNSISSSIIKLLKDEKLRNSMGKAGKERLEREFSFERFKERLKEILCQ